MIADTHTGLGALAPSPQLLPAAQRKLAFKRYSDALAQGDDDEAADALAAWLRLAGVAAPAQAGEGKGDKR